MLSKEFIDAVYNSGMPVYQVANIAGVAPNALYKLLRRIDHANPGNKKVEKVAKVIGFDPSECYAEKEKQ